MTRTTFVLPSDLSLHSFSQRYWVLTGPLGSLLLEVDTPLTVDGRRLICPSPRVARQFAAAVDTLRVGVSQTYSLVGTGFKAEHTPEGTRIKVGYSHDTHLATGEDWFLHLENPTTLTLYGLHPGRVGALGASLRDLRRPDPYKAKGVRVQGKTYRLREGKKK